MAAINKIAKEDCSGCSACMAVCKRSCIEMKADSEGFLYPVVSAEGCNDCGICETFCPILNASSSNQPYDTVFAAKHRDKAKVRASSSGGVFSFLAESVLKEGGVVCAARFDEQFRLIHDFCCDINELSVYKGSKYVQSDMGNCYLGVRERLKEGRKVLFVGTGCQVMGLKLFLGKEFANLLTLEVLCHGTPSPLAWKNYLFELCKRRKIALKSGDSVEFRSKRKSWRRYSLRIQREGKTLYAKDLFHDPFLISFGRNLLSRPSCHRCKAKNFASKSDIVAGDYWGVDNFFPRKDDDSGISFIMLKDRSLLSLFESGEMEIWQTRYADVLRGNPSLELSSKPNPNREKFFDALSSYGFIKAAYPYIQFTASQKRKRRIAQFKRFCKSCLDAIR